jgi:isopentenyl phosphate kinase
VERVSLIFLKLGGSLITDKSKPYTLRGEVISRLCREIHEARMESRSLSLLIGHGGGSFPHVSASKYQTHLGAIHKDSWEGFSKVQDDAAKLNRIIVSALIEAGENAISIQPSASCISREGRITEWYTKSIESALSKGVIPVPYGDVSFDDKKGFCIISTEEILRFLANKLNPKMVIMAGKVDGVLDGKGRVIGEISRGNLHAVSKLLMSSDGIADVTGGMVHKVKKSLDIGVPVEIINGMRPGFLKRALLGERGLGTIIRS